MYPPIESHLRVLVTLGMLTLCAGIAGAQEATAGTPSTESTPPAVEAPEAGAAPESEAVAAPESESGAAPVPEPGSESESGAAPVPESGSESESGAAPVPEPGSEPESEPESGADAGQAAPASGAHGSGAHGGVQLPGSLRLNGRFDLLAEHGGYRDQPFQGGEDRFRNFHHFVFLSRDAPGDPFGLNVELIDQTFYEFSFHHRPEGAPWKLGVTAGKVLVPFGAEPVFHQSYGGRAGFDQEVLPVIWARLGASVKFQYAFAGTGIRLANDSFVVQGHRLSGGDEVLDLQSDLAGSGDSRFGLGDRLGLSWGPLSAWYSIYFNRLGFGRQLLMQAIDMELWRMHEVPVLEDFTFGLGALRADISGGEEQGFGGSGKDYYHFATYVRVRYFPLRWLYLQYRQGIQTFDNRRGTYRDDTRLDERDNATHNIAAVARYRGMSVGLYHFWYLEEANETDNDFTRLAVTYDF